MSRNEALDGWVGWPARPTKPHDGGHLESPILFLDNAPEGFNLPVKTVGQELRAERERRGIELDDIWIALKIRPSYVIAIEESRFDDLPSRAFAIGYVGRYARYLRLDIERLVERVESEMPPREGPRNAPLEIAPPPERNHRVAVLTCAGLVVIALAYFRNDIAALSTWAYEPRTAANLASVGSASTAPAAEQPARDVAPERVPPRATEVTAPPSPTPRSGFSPEPLSTLPPGRQYGLGNQVSRITLRVHRPTLVAVRGERNRDFLERPLSPGDTYRVPNVGGLTLTAEDAGAVEIILDGTSVGFAGPHGAAASELSLHPQSIINRARASGR